MRVLSVNVGSARTVEHEGRQVRTAIFKAPVAGPVRVARETLVGDVQADRRYHGGPNQAVYGYPHEHYATWAEELGRDDFALGQFGENLTTEGLLETEVRIGDVFAIGTARLQISQPRTPCSKLGLRMGDPSFVKTFLHADRVGFYFRVLEEGELAAGDAIRLVERDEASLPVAEVHRLRHLDKGNREGAARAASLAALSEEWREAFAKRANEIR